MASGDLNPAYVDAVINAFKEVPYFQLLGMSMKSLAKGQCEMIIPAEHKHLNPHAGVHGGVVASIIDASCYWAAYSGMKTENAIVTIDLKISYLSPGREGETLLATGQAVKPGRTTGVAEAKVVAAESGRLVGYGSATVLATDAPMAGVLADLPPKFAE
jgi:uncharacterized protein (TIGR00369 family)